MQEHPVALILTDDLRRSRVTVFFRLVLAIPHLIWAALWTVLVSILAIVGWLIAVVTGRIPVWLHGFFCAYVRYVAHVSAFVALTGNPFPGFVGAEGSYPIDIRLPASPERQARLRTFFRLILALPATFVTGALGGGGATGGFLVRGLGLTGVSGVLGWFAALFTARMPRGLRDAGAYGIGYRAQVLAYLLFLTERYPTADPGAVFAGNEPPPLHPVRLVTNGADLRRSRVTVLFRLPLLIPLIVWLYLWGIIAELILIVQWFITLFRGRPAAKLHGFLARYVRYYFHVAAFASLAGNPFPGFTGRFGTYPLDLALPGPERQNRWKTGFRILLAFPALFVQGVLFGALFVDAILVWFVALFLGRTPEGLRNLSAFALRYFGQVYAYVFLLTDAYPNASPVEGAAVPDVVGVSGEPSIDQPV